MADIPQQVVIPPENLVLGSNGRPTGKVRVYDVHRKGFREVPAVDAREQVFYDSASFSEPRTQVSVPKGGSGKSSG